MRVTQNERNEKLLNILLEHPYLHDGMTAEAAYNYLLGRTHSDRRNEKWRKSPRTLAYWMKRRGFDSQRSGDVNRYFWKESEVSEESNNES